MSTPHPARVIDTTAWVGQLQQALRILWPDLPAVYFTEAAALSPMPGDPGPGHVLTEEERGQLTRVAHAIARTAPDRLAHLEAVEAAADRLVSVMDGFYPQSVQDALLHLAQLTGHLTPRTSDTNGA